MSEQYAIVAWVAPAEQRPCPKPPDEFDAREVSELFGERLLRFLHPLVQHLHDVNKVDKRPLKTLVQVVEAILAFRDEAHGLVLSELGDYLDRLHGGGGGTKRLATLIHHEKWQAQEMEAFLWGRAKAQLEDWEGQGQDGLLSLRCDDAGKTGEPQSRGIVSGALEQRGPADACEKRLLSSSWCSHLCARAARHRGAVGRPLETAGPADVGGVEMVDLAGSVSQL